MLTTLMKLLSACLWPSSGRSVDSSGKQDGLLWYKDSGQHLLGDFSMAVVQANNLLEDQSQVESGPLSTLASGPYGTFIGIYDGHGGPETSRFVNDHLFQHLKRFAAEQGSMSMDVIRKAYEATEEGFLGVVTKQWPVKPLIAAVGSCCLVGVICGGMLYIANVGDSRAVLGRAMKATGEAIALQLSAEHNVSIESVRQEMHSLHPDDSHIVVLKHNVWRVKGLIQVSRSIGDMYLKKAEFNREPLYTKYRLREPIKRPILSGEPSITEHELQPQDQFLIFASDGLWEQLSNQEAVDIVQNHPRNGIARRLVKMAANFHFSSISLLFEILLLLLQIHHLILKLSSTMISVVILAELMVEYTSAIAKLTVGMLPRRQGGDSNVVRVGGFILPCPSPTGTNRSSPFPDFSSHLVDF